AEGGDLFHAGLVADELVHGGLGVGGRLRVGVGDVGGGNPLGFVGFGVILLVLAVVVGDELLGLGAVVRGLLGIELGVAGCDEVGGDRAGPGGDGGFHDCAA